jgi:hypothetical protein
MTDATASHINWARLLKQCHTELGISTYPRVSITSNRRPDAEAAKRGDGVLDRRGFSPKSLRPERFGASRWFQ